MPRYDIYAGDYREVDKRFNEIMGKLPTGERGPWLKQFVVTHYGLEQDNKDLSALKNMLKAEILDELRDVTINTDDKNLGGPVDDVLRQKVEKKLGAMVDAWD
jgi:hypothetical protein